MKEFIIAFTIGAIVGGLVVGFWSTKIWPWIKSENAAVGKTLSADATAAATNAGKIVASAAKDATAAVEKKI